MRDGTSWREKYPKYGNLVPRDIASREIFWICQEGYGIGGGNMVYLDISHLPEVTKDKLEGILEIYEKFTGDDPRTVPMKIFSAVHYSMGGLYTTYTAKDDHKGMVMGAPDNMMTNVRGLYAFGEVNYQYHGATRLGANALLSCIFDGLFCGLSVVNYARDEVPRLAVDLPDTLFDSVVEQENNKVKRLIESQGQENPYRIHQQLGEEMTEACTVIREEQRMQNAYGVLIEMKDRYQNAKLSDTSAWTNQNLSFTRALGDMLIYAEAILAGAIARKESRGSHYRPDYPDRNDEEYLKTTIAKYDAAADRAVLEYEAVPQPLVQPRARTYGEVVSEPEHAESEAPAAATT